MAKKSLTNSFLSPLIEELNEAWFNGIRLHSSISGNIESFYLALLSWVQYSPQVEKYVAFLFCKFHAFVLSIKGIFLSSSW